MSAPQLAMTLLKDQEIRVPSCGSKRKHTKRVAEVGPNQVVDGYEKVMQEGGGRRVQKVEGGGEAVAEAL